MQSCRICQTEKNLKYTVKELRTVNSKKQRLSEGHFIGSTPSTTGNICIDCEERLQNFLQLDEDENSITVDDDELSYKLLLEKIANKSALGRRVTSGTVGEVIEVLTSRENTPSPLPAPAVVIAASAPLAEAGVKHKVVAFIDLEAEDETDLKGGGAPVSDNEEIVFRSVESESDVRKQRPAVKKNQSRRIEKRKLRLVASLSLVSSDESDCESPRPAVEPTTPVTTDERVNTSTATDTDTAPATAANCERIESKKRDFNTQSSGGSLTTRLRCPVCQCAFPTVQRLIHHMRCKHRSYDGEMLREGLRCGQDSAMTIRLRYQERCIYYECQLCGRIDAVFKIHKQHVMEQHSAESKSLKDPMMQELKCPVCKEKCGTQHVLLCRHILSSHNAAEYKGHLQEVTHMRKKFSCKISRQKELRRSSRIFQFPKWKQYFFECKFCKKVVTGDYNFLKHVNTHSQDAAAHTCDTGTNTKEPPPPPRKKLKQTPATNNTKEKTERKSALQQSTKSNVSKKYTEPKPKALKNQRRHKLTRKAIQASLVKVKVKPPLRHFPTQKYKCRWCAQVFKGFHRLNLHQLSAHNTLEYTRCDHCACVFSSEAAVEQHMLRHSGKSKRKHFETCRSVDENCNTDCKRGRLVPKVHTNVSSCSEVTYASEEGAAAPNMATWLQDLMLLRKEHNSNDTTLPQRNNATKDYDKVSRRGSAFNSGAAHQCSYCTHLFASAEELHLHVGEHQQRKEVPILRRLTAANMSTSMLKVRSPDNQ